MRKKKRVNLQTSSKAISDGLLEATIVLQISILRGLTKDRTLVKRAENRAAAVLVSAGLSQNRVSKILSIKTERVNKACKSIKL